MSLSFSRYVRFIFHVYPVFSLPVISLHRPSCRLVSLSFGSLSFALHSPCFHFCPFHVPFSSPLFPFHFPLLSCHVDFLFPPLISLHFLAFPLCSPVFPAKRHCFFQRFRKRGRRAGHDLQEREDRTPSCDLCEEEINGVTLCCVQCIWDVCRECAWPSTYSQCR